jgi:radical SAM superfamily enzyme YgiQ (UPF0313 family)
MPGKQPGGVADLLDPVTLVTPPSPFLLDERVFVNLGILKVAASLESCGSEVEHLDLSGIANFLTPLEHHLSSTSSRAIGLTTTTPQLPAVVQIVEMIRRLRPDLRIILGGPHVTLTHSAVKLEQKSKRRSRAHVALDQLLGLADVLVSGDGERAAIAALALEAPPLIDGDDPRGSFFLTNQAYDASPYPARHLVDLGSYRYQIDGRPATSLIAQLGCPFGCGFCGGRNSSSLRTIRMRSAASILNEIRSLYQTYGYTGFMFYDDELNVNRGMLSLMEGLRELADELQIEFRFRGFVKAQLLTAEQAQAMYGAGFRWVLTGFESGAPRILENINKCATRDENSRARDVAGDAGLKVKALMSVGHPGETEETIRQTHEWLLASAPDEFDCSVITTYPGTPYYDEAIPHDTDHGVWTYTYRKTGDRLHAYDVDFLTVADYYKGDPNGGYRSFVFTDTLSADAIVSRRDWIEASVRSALSLPYPQARPALRYEHSMGQGANRLPGYILGQGRACAAP